MATCPICTGKLPEGTGRCRSRTYCGDACRRSAELEIRRIDRRLGALADSISQLRRERSEGRGLVLELKAATTETGRQQKRLLEVVSAGEAETTSERARK